MQTMNIWQNNSKTKLNKRIQFAVEIHKSDLHYSKKTLNLRKLRYLWWKCGLRFICLGIANVYLNTNVISLIFCFWLNYIFLFFLKRDLQTIRVNMSSFSMAMVFKLMSLISGSLPTLFLNGVYYSFIK